MDVHGFILIASYIQGPVFALTHLPGTDKTGFGQVKIGKEFI
jgi:hypothetical protein